MLESPVAQGIAGGLLVSTLFAGSIAFAHWTGAGLTGYLGAVVFQLVVVAVVAEVRARRKKAA